MNLRVHSHSVKANVKAKKFFDVSIFFFDLFRLFFDLFRFRVRFRSMWTGLNAVEIFEDEYLNWVAMKMTTLMFFWTINLRAELNGTKHKRNSEIKQDIFKNSFSSIFHCPARLMTSFCDVTLTPDVTFFSFNDVTPVTGKLSILQILY